MSAALVSRMLAAMPLPALFVGDEARIVAANDAAGHILGHGLVGRHYVTALRQPAALEAIEQVLAGKSAARTRFLGRDGGEETIYDLRCAA
ncbi:MAG: two-component sensor histidine kinase, partial [Pseudomonadota bacterium]